MLHYNLTTTFLSCDNTIGLHILGTRRDLPARVRLSSYEQYEQYFSLI